MNINDISTQLLFMTTPIVTKKANGDVSVGTGFFFNKAHPTDPNLFLPVLVTNSHVVSGATEGLLQLYRSDNDGKPLLGDKINVNLDKTFMDAFVKSDEYDLAVIPMTGIFNHLAKSGQKIFFRAADKTVVPNDTQISELGAMEDVVFIGYPSGIVDKKNGLPVIRKGITASPLWGKCNGKNEFLIDAGIFPGSSGSPVFILNQGSFASGQNLVVGTRVMLVGLIFQTIQSASDKAYLGLGKAVSTSEVIKLLSKFDKG